MSNCEALISAGCYSPSSQVRAVAKLASLTLSWALDCRARGDRAAMRRCALAFASDFRALCHTQAALRLRALPAAAIEFLTRWWIRELINAALRPMFFRYRQAERDGETAKATRCELLFFRMLNRCDCFPFCIEIDRWGFWILDEPSEQDDFWRNDEQAFARRVPSPDSDFLPVS